MWPIVQALHFMSTQRKIENKKKKHPLGRITSFIKINRKNKTKIIKKHSIQTVGTCFFALVFCKILEKSLF